MNQMPEPKGTIQRTPVLGKLPPAVVAKEAARAAVSCDCTDLYSRFQEEAAARRLPTRTNPTRPPTAVEASGPFVKLHRQKAGL